MAEPGFKDPEIKRLIRLEAKQQKETINLIASENYASKAVLEAQGSILTDKYAEGYPGRRYYGGCSYIDEIESLAIERVKKLYLAEHANVQPHAGSQANMAAYMALLNYGDTVMGMSLSHGGHLTHGSQVNFSGKWYIFIPYGVNRETELIDYDEIERIALKHRPKLIVAGASAYPRRLDFQRFREIANKSGARLMVDMAHIAGIVAAKLHDSPIPHADVVTSSTHKTLRGPRSGFILCKKGMAEAVDAAVFPGVQGGPLVHAIAAKAVCFGEAMEPSFFDYQRRVCENASLLAAELKERGMCLVTDGTDNHIVLVNLTSKGLTGEAAQEALEATGILVNKNTIPFDTRPPKAGSGIRLGTPAVTTRGFGTEEIKRVADMIVRLLSDPTSQKLREKVRDEVKDLCRHFPVPGS